MAATKIKEVLRVYGFLSLFLIEMRKRCGNSEKHFFYHGMKMGEILAKNTMNKLQIYFCFGFIYAVFFLIMCCFSFSYPWLSK